MGMKMDVSRSVKLCRLPPAFSWTVAVALAVAPLPWRFVNRAVADDWPQWGGPQRDLVWRETGVVETLPDGELPRVWSAPLGEGYAGPAVADGRVFAVDRVAEQNIERVHAFSAEDGSKLWTREYPARYSISYPAGPRCTPTVDGDRVYSLGAVGHLFCLDTASGDVVWECDLRERFGTELPIWGMAGAPLVDGDQLIVLAGGANGALVVSLNKADGAERWRALDDPDVGYCPPVILEFGGRRQLIVWHPSAVSAIDPIDGELLWEAPFAVRAGLCIATPRKLGRRLFITSFYDGPLMIDLGDDGRSPEILWRTGRSSTEITNDSLHSIMSTPIVTEEFIYGVGSMGELRCLDANNGEIVWETFAATGKGRWWNAFLIPRRQTSGASVFLHNEQGDLITARLTGDGYHESSRAQLIAPTRRVRRRMTIWSHPAFAMQSVFARNDECLIRVDLAER
ncbi:MAG: PQQ-binding-like beta-propeller repeat protein, partial [Planctomycetota bacterium]